MVNKINQTRLMNEFKLSFGFGVSIYWIESAYHSSNCLKDVAKQYAIAFYTVKSKDVAYDSNPDWMFYLVDNLSLFM